MTPRRSPAAAVAVALIAVSGCAGQPERQARNLDELVAYRRAENTLQSNELHRLGDKFLVRMAAKAAAAGKSGGRATIDVLVISGGGDWARSAPAC